MVEPRQRRIETPLDAVITISDAPPHFPGGFILELRMKNPDDTRRAGVYLDSSSLDQLIIGLETFQEL